MNYNIVIDNREPSQIFDQFIEACQISGWLKHSFNNNITGDFVFEQIKGEEVYRLAIFERKTWNDLACSIKDGRCESQNIRLLDAKNKGTKVYYVIEGFMPPPEGYTCGMLNKCLFGMLDCLLAKEFCVVHTRDEGNTVDRVINICKFISESSPPLYKSYTEMYLDKLNRCPEEVSKDVRDELKVIHDKYGGTTICDTIVIDKTETTPYIVKCMWMTMTSENIANVIMKSGYAIKDIYDVPNIVCNLKYETGRKITAKSLNKIKNGIKTVESIMLMLKEIKGAGSNAEIFIEKIGLNELMNLKESIVIENGGRKLNKNILPKFIECINFRL
jgi:ERCC4-type nuclease